MSTKTEKSCSKQVPVQASVQKPVPLQERVGNTKNFFCREKYWELMNAHYGFQVFKSEPGARLRKCTFGDCCRGAHSEEEINTLPANHQFNVLDKSKLDLVSIYNDICNSMESNRKLVRHPTFKTEIANYKNMDFVELLQFWYRITCYHRKVKKELIKNENLYYKTKDSVPEFFLENEDIVWPLERVTKMCQKHFDLQNKIADDSDKPVIWDICCGSINCKEGCHNKGYMICKEDLLTGQCSCLSNEDLAVKREEIDLEIRSTEMILSKLISFKKKKSFESTKRQLQNQYRNTVRMIHLSEHGLVPFNKQMEEHKKMVEKEEQKLFESKKSREQIVSKTVAKKKIKKPVL